MPLPSLVKTESEKLAAAIAKLEQRIAEKNQQIGAHAASRQAALCDDDEKVLAAWRALDGNLRDEFTDLQALLVDRQERHATAMKDETANAVRARIEKHNARVRKLVPWFINRYPEIAAEAAKHFREAHDMDMVDRRQLGADAKAAGLDDCAVDGVMATVAREIGTPHRDLLHMAELPGLGGRSGDFWNGATGTSPALDAAAAKKTA